MHQLDNVATGVQAALALLAVPLHDVPSPAMRLLLAPNKDVSLAGALKREDLPRLQVAHSLDHRCPASKRSMR